MIAAAKSKGSTHVHFFFLRVALRRIGAASFPARALRLWGARYLIRIVRDKVRDIVAMLAIHDGSLIEAGR